MNSTIYRRILSNCRAVPFTKSVTSRQLPEALASDRMSTIRSFHPSTTLTTNTPTMPFLRLGYKRIHYADLKPQNDVRETFIFMHGLGSSQDYYHAVTQGLLASGFRCIIFDNTGAGRSPYTFIEQTIQTLGDDIIGILDALEVSKAVVVGHSMGGYVPPRND
jgi:pimeloyl-ACP methyl ester carboxylesterase